MTLEQYLHEKVSHKKRINETKFVHNDKRYSTQKVDVVLIFINNKIQRSKLTSENLILLLKFALCILVFCIKAHSKNSDNTNIDTEKPSCTTSSTISKPRNHQVFLENFTQSTKRACLSLAFDIPTILRQVTGSSYKNIAHDLFSKKIPYIGLLSVHSAETFLRSQVIYSLYLTVTPQAKVLMPDLSKEYPLIPQLCATTIIAGSDVICMNPFERIKVCLLNKRDIPFFDTKINWAQLENFYFTFFFMDFTKKNRLFLLYSGTYSRLMRGFVIAAQDASALHNK